MLFPAVISCGAGKIGYGVILWSSDNQQFPTGSIVHVMEESRIKGTYTIRNNETKNITEIPSYLVSFFKKKGDAEEYAGLYSEYAPLLARAEKDGLPVRETPDALGTRLYRLKKQQIFKILEREEEPTQEGELEGYWYQILTDDGVKGYCFSPYLTIINMYDEGDAGGNISEKTPVSRLLEAPWRPDFFALMLSKDTIDLTRMKKEYGLFPDSKKHTIRLNLPDHSEEFSYTDIVSVGNNTLRINGTPLEVTFIRENRIDVIYSHQEKMFNQTFVRLNADLNDIIQKELESREEEFGRLIEKSSVVSSSAYGTITFGDYPLFTWENFKRLVPEVIPADADGSGKIDFNLFIDDELRNSYTGSFMFHFNGTEPGTVTRFLYQLQENGIRLTFVPSDAVKDNIVTAKNPSPVVLFFSYVDQ
jgi:hypothetical protein